MKPLAIALFAALLLPLCFDTSQALSYPPPAGSIDLSGHLTTACLPHGGGPVYLQISLDVRDFPLPARAYQPMNIAVVLDRSGSMADQRKIEYAKESICALVDRLSTNDYLSIVIYDDRIETLLPTQRVSDKAYIKRLVQNVFPRGSTNLGGGMEEGFRQIERNFSREYVNRVILLSDGLANQGITDPVQLDRVASQYRSRSISLTTIGVGLEYNENLMLGLAEHGGGNYYFVESPSQLASILEKELNGMTYTVARDARIELTLGGGVTAGDVIGCDRRPEGDRLVIPVGDLFATDHREFTVQLNVGEGSGSRHIATGVLRFSNERELAITTPKFSTDIRYTDDAVELKRGVDWNTQGKVDIAVSTKSVERAMEALDAGNKDEAEATLKEAAGRLQSSASLANSPAAAPAIQDQISQLQKYSEDMRADSSDMRKVKKSLQYYNYRTQKKK
jgi:Ca-activated chloride channel family protein